MTEKAVSGRAGSVLSARIGTTVRSLAGCAAAFAVLATASGCSSAPSTAQGEKLASSSRAPVAHEYWDVLGAVYGDIETNLAPGHGFLSVCPVPSGRSSQFVAYNVGTDIAARDPHLSSAQFLALVEKTLQGQGWGKFSPSHGYLVSAKNAYNLYLQRHAGNQSFLLSLTLNGPCISVGSNFASAAPGLNDRISDEYPNSEVSAKPAPTSPWPSP